jgi:hypothetical protein
VVVAILPLSPDVDTDRLYSSLLAACETFGQQQQQKRKGGPGGDMDMGGRRLWLLAAGCWPGWLLAAGCWLLAALALLDPGRWGCREAAQQAAQPGASGTPCRARRPPLHCTALPRSSPSSDARPQRP